MPKKLYCFVDESGQDTKGELFVVGVVLAPQDRDELEACVLRLERQSGKGRLKWSSAQHQRRMAFVEGLARESAFTGRLFTVIRKDARAYLQMTAEAAAEVVTRYAGDSGTSLAVHIILDGLQRHEQAQFRQAVSRLGLQRVRVAGTRDEASPLVRLADCVAGLVRMAIEDGEEAQALVNRLKRSGLLTDLS